MPQGSFPCRFAAIHLQPAADKVVQTETIMQAITVVHTVTSSVTASPCHLPLKGKALGCCTPIVERSDPRPPVQAGTIVPARDVEDAVPYDMIGSA